MKEEYLLLTALLLSSPPCLFVLYLLHVMAEVMNADESMQILKYSVWESFTYLYNASSSQMQSILHNLFPKSCLQSALCGKEGSLA